MSATGFGTAVASTQTGKTQFHRPILPQERRCPEKVFQVWAGKKRRWAMYTGTMIEDLIATVERAECRIEPVEDEMPVAYLIEQLYGQELVVA
jgi:hypothetical protein